MGRKFVPILVAGNEKKIYLDDITKVYKRKIKKVAIPLPFFSEERKVCKVLRIESQFTLD